VCSVMSWEQYGGTHSVSKVSQDGEVAFRYFKLTALTIEQLSGSSQVDIQQLFCAQVIPMCRGVSHAAWGCPD
jgi:hypothetical protein